MVPCHGDTTSGWIGATRRGDSAESKGMEMRTANAIGRRTSLKILAAGVALGVLPLASSALAQSLSGELTFMVAEYSPKTAPFWKSTSRVSRRPTRAST